MSAEPSPDQTAPHGLDAGIALALRAQDSGEWKPVVDWLARNPALAEPLARFVGGERQLVHELSQPRSAALSGTELGGIELISELGRGAMGVVYRGHDRALRRDVAVKMVRGEDALSVAELARLRAEGEVAAGLDHPNVVPILAFGEANGTPYLVMPLVPGGTLAGQIKERGERRHGAEEAARLVRDVALGVHHAHQRGLIHRDLKPANILLDRQEQKVVPRIADFGLARRVDATTSMGIAGTFAYMAPEQAQGGRPLTTAVDVHALGVILFELLTGRVPYTGDVPAVLKKLTDPNERAPTVAGVPTDLAAVCRKCLEREPGDRYGTAQELADDLDRFLRREPVKARPPGLWGSVVREVLRTQFENPTAWGWLTLYSGLLVVAVHLFYAWAISAQLPRGPFAAATAANALALLVLYWVFLRNRQFRTGDRHSLSVWVGTLAATALLPVVNRPAEGGDLTAYRLSLYPLLALLTGVATFALAGPFWGGFWLIGAAYFALALVMAAIPPIAPVAFALFQGLTLIALGWYMIRVGDAGDTP